jgi:hypothetical protein
MGDQDQAHVRASLPVWRVLQFGRFGPFRQSGCDNYYAAALAAAGLNRLVPKAGSKTFLHGLFTPIQGVYYRLWSRMLLIGLGAGCSANHILTVAKYKVYLILSSYVFSMHPEGCS